MSEPMSAAQSVPVVINNVPIALQHALATAHVIFTSPTREATKLKRGVGKGGCSWKASPTLAQNNLTLCSRLAQL